MKRSQQLYFGDIIEAISKILTYTTGKGFKSFSSDGMTIDAVVRNFEILGEAAKHISPALKDKYPDIPWQEMTAMRNKVIHEYFGVDVEIIWETVNNILPELLKVLKKTCKQEFGG